MAMVPNSTWEKPNVEALLQASAVVQVGLEVRRQHKVGASASLRELIEKPWYYTQTI